MTTETTDEPASIEEVIDRLKVLAKDYAETCQFYRLEEVVRVLGWLEGIWIMAGLSKEWLNEDALLLDDHARFMARFKKEILQLSCERE